MVLPQRQVRDELLIELDVMGERPNPAGRRETLFSALLTALPVPKPSALLHACLHQWVFYLLNLCLFPRGMPWFSSALIMSPGPLPQPTFSFTSN